ncbi:hypothetical protein IID20_01540 [Patescibacteria group bacterium]|nr:hypothetical protein [Patescibacteria group bacterium]
MKYFISSKWRNRDKVLELTKKLRNKGKFVYCFFESKANIYSTDMDPKKVMEEFEAIENWQNNKYIKAIFKDTVIKIKDSDVLVMLLPAGSSTHIEAGIAYGLEKKCIVIGKKKETDSMYLIFNEFYNSIDEFIDSIL